jgi:hypothetical protein
MLVDSGGGRPDELPVVAASPIRQLSWGGTARYPMANYRGAVHCTFQFDDVSGIDLPGQRSKKILVFALINLLRPRKSRSRSC